MWEMKLQRLESHYLDPDRLKPQRFLPIITTADMPLSKVLHTRSNMITDGVNIQLAATIVSISAPQLRFVSAADDLARQQAAVVQPAFLD